MSDAISIANRWIDAYNAKDFATLKNLMTDDIHIEHHNRGVKLDGPQTMLAIMNQFGELLPDRRFHSIRKQFSNGNHVVTELTWEGTPTADIEGFGKKGETVRLELACVWTVCDGRICDYHDYG